MKLLICLKNIYEKLTANVIINNERWECLLPESRNKTKMFTQHGANVATSAMRQEKEIKGTWITKKERKLPKFADDIILLIKKIQHNLQKNSTLINEFNKCTGHKRNT